MTLNDATLNQIAAARPQANTWLSANAGSGKTRVLTDRVARLLLSGVSPQNILCLTYTKAAASEMQNRLFDRLGDWAMKPDESLRRELADLGVTDVDDLREARRLFAGAIETPGGLKIQTIHSFCSSILRRFPLEAGVSPDFTEMDERAAKILQAEIVEEMARDARRPLVEAVARHFTGADFEAFCGAIVRFQAGFEAPVSANKIKDWLKLDPKFDARALHTMAFLPDDGALLAALIPILVASGGTDLTAANKLLQIDTSSLSVADLPLLESTFLFGEKANSPFGAKIGSLPKKAAREGAAAEILPKLEALMMRIEMARTPRLTLALADKTHALHGFAHAFVREYAARKQARGWLDFDDLISRAGALLNDADVTAWVLYRLDGGIDHILVDEAQDTSPTQWRVIESLAREFMAGESARSGAKRTIFVVGDPKQSIYSFQGADPAEFSRMRDLFRSGLKDVEDDLHERSLDYSFRSSKAVLSLVDETLAQAPGLGGAFHHEAFFDAMPGRVDLWPVIEGEANPEPADWHDPVDMLAPRDEKVQIAEQIAQEIETLLMSGSIPDNKGVFRKVTAGDILVLVQRRSPIFHEIIRACKQRDLPIAGADRLRIGGELAVKDISSLLKFLATPEDDLSLATVLRSPLFGWSEDRLFRLAHGRKKTFLWNALRVNEKENAQVLTVLNDLRREADFLRPYDLIERLLTRHDGRRRLTARLGQEAVDGIDTLLQQALGYERMEVPSLTGFLTWLDADDIEVKRELGSKGGQIRVMTVHGSKGLEAPIVILPDTAKRKKRPVGDLVELSDGKVIWAPKSADTPTLLRPVLSQLEKRDLEERNRLLYVAMTRAENWLIVAAAGDVGKETGDSWYNTIRAGMERTGAQKLLSSHNGIGLRLQSGEWQPAKDVSNEISPDTPIIPATPIWLREHAKPPIKPVGPLVPSELGGAKVIDAAVQSSSDEDAKMRGRQVHRLLEFLPEYPQEDWPKIARDLLAFGEDAAPDAQADILFASAKRVLSAPELAPLFAADALAEVEVSAPVQALGATRIHGIIDRLILTQDTITAVDFKTNRTVPVRAEDIPEGILRQLGAYEIALAEVYPKHEIRSAVLWTEDATLMKLPHGLAISTFRRLDGDGNHT